MLFKFKVHTFSVSCIILSVLNGMGHLWFIPMLFWCFLVMWWIEKKQLKERLVFVALFGLSVLPMPTLPLGLGIVPHYLFYFYGGYLLYKYKQEVLKRLSNWRVVILLALVYVVFLQIRIYATNWHSANMLRIVQKIPILTTCNILRSIVSVSGIIALYLTVCHITEKDGYMPKKMVIWSNSVCYGVYIYHQFILQYRYYETALPTHVNRYVLPWLTFVITLMVSISLTTITLKTKFGKFLIG